jgi:hypothetical protein
MFFIICGGVAFFLLAILNHSGFAKNIGNAVVTSICYVTVLLFIVVTFTHAVRKSFK